MMIARRTMIVTGCALALASCGENLGKGPVLHVASGYIQMGANDDAPAAGYFTVKGGGAPVDLVAVTADLAQRVEMHTSVKEDGMVVMKPLLSAPVPARGELQFKPGANHLMIWKINGAAVRAGKLPMVFVFSDNKRIVFDLKIKAAGAAGAADEAHAGH